MSQAGYTPILIYSSSTASNAPAAGNLTNSTLGSELAINITDGKLFYKDNADAIQVIGWKVTPTSAGGTGLTSYTAGDMLYYASGTTLSKLAIGSADYVMTSSGTAPQWSQFVKAISGGTGQTSYAVGDILYANTTTTLAKLADVATGNALISGGVGVAPSWGKIGLTTHVSGTLPIANGGTNATATPTAGAIAYGTGSAYAFSAAGTSGNVLISGGSGAPTWTGGPTFTATTKVSMGEAYFGLEATNASGRLWYLISGGNGNISPGVFAIWDGGTGAHKVAEFLGGSSGTTFTSDANNYLLVGYASSNGAYKLQVNSQIYATSSTIATSDGKYKDNQQPLTGALALVEALQPKTFTWKQGEAADGVRNPNFGKPTKQFAPEVVDGKEVLTEKIVTDTKEWLREPHNFGAGVQVGFIAQEVQQALTGQPYLENIIKKNVRQAVVDENGNEIAPESEFLGIAEGNLIALLAAAIKELKADFDAYKAAHP